MTNSSDQDISDPDVLIVDDSADIRLYLKTLLSNISITSVEAADGAEALKVLSRRVPRVIVSDIRMPRMNGYELLHTVRRSKSDYSTTPFVLLTGLNDGELVDVAEKFGVSAFFSKPLDADRFRDTIRTLLANAKEARRETIARAMAEAVDRTEPEQAASVERLHEIIMEDGANRQTFGHIICLGTEEIRQRVGEDHWEKLRASVSRLMIDAVDAVCRPDDVYLSCEDGSVVIVFGDNDIHHAEAAAAKAAKHVSDALFGSEEMNGVKVTSIVRTADGYVTAGKKNVSEVIETLLKLARKHVVGAGKAAVGTETTPGAPKRAAKKPELKSSIPSFRGELMNRLDAGSEKPIEFRFLPVWNIQKRTVNMFTCLPSREMPIERKPLWGYSVLGRSPELSQIVELDIACLEYGLLEIMSFLSAGKPTYLGMSVHFETLASKNAREKLLSLLREIPENIRKYIGPILTHAPDGIPENRIAEITGELRAMTHFMSVEVFPSDEGRDVLRTVSRMRGGGIQCIMSRVADDKDQHQIQMAQKVGERVRQLGGTSGVTGIRNFSALMEVAYSPLDFCTGKALGGPYEHPPEPFPFDAKSLERRKTPR